MQPSFNPSAVREQAETALTITTQVYLPHDPSKGNEWRVELFRSYWGGVNVRFLKDGVLVAISILYKEASLFPKEAPLVRQVIKTASPSKIRTLNAVGRAMIETWEAAEAIQTSALRERR